ncbi:MAG: PspC domain-containing protein [Peptostreptococcaceae bacterium]|nr:PspC domain-containing protein [Peptostreptococcaceae bacterium]
MEKRLYRSRKDKVISGVCGGIAEYFEIDSTIIRLVWVILIFLAGTGIVAYIIAAIIIPEEPEYASYSEKDETSEEYEAHQIEYENEPKEKKVEEVFKKNKKNRNAIGVILILLGIFFFARRMFYWVDFAYIWPLLLVGTGLYFIIKKD